MGHLTSDSEDRCSRSHPCRMQQMFWFSCLLRCFNEHNSLDSFLLQLCIAASKLIKLHRLTQVLNQPNEQIHPKQHCWSGTKTRLTSFLLPPTAQIAGLINNSEGSDFQSSCLGDWNHMLSVPSSSAHSPLSPPQLGHAASANPCYIRTPVYLGHIAINFLGCKTGKYQRESFRV